MKLLRKRKGKWIAIAVAAAVMVWTGGPASAEEMMVSLDSDQPVTAVSQSPAEGQPALPAEPNLNSNQAAAETAEEAAAESGNSASIIEAAGESADSSANPSAGAEEVSSQSSYNPSLDAKTVPDQAAEETLPSTGEETRSSMGSNGSSSLQEDVQPLDNHSLIKTSAAWEAGYKGEGQVIAVIDAGIDPEHPAFAPLTDASRAYYQSQMQLEAAKQAAGIDYGRWYNDKLVFAHNYSDWNDAIKEKDAQSHGSHVASIAAGKPAVQPIGTLADPVGESLVSGVAPEAQLMLMRVSSDSAGIMGTREYLFAKAVEDAIALGATAINLSLVSFHGAQFEIGDSLAAALKAAQEAGIVVTIAGGNTGAFGYGVSNPAAANPDYGLTSIPAVAKDALAVASFDNASTVGKAVRVLGLEGDARYNGGYFEINTEANQTAAILEEADTYKDKVFDYVYAGLGQEADWADLDLEGKFALVERGAITFTEKAQRAKAAGASGIIIFNQAGDETASPIGLSGEDLEGFPILSMGHSNGRLLAEQAASFQLTFPDGDFRFASPSGGQPSAFSSWGLTADGELKPDLSAPGGSVYAAVNDGKYGNQSGTSMAAPHAAGALALLRQQFREKYPQLSGADLTARLKQVLMSSADPHFNAETQAYTSPRQQGAGLINLEKALQATVYAIGTDGEAKVNLGNVGDRFSFEVQLHNTANYAQTFQAVAHVGTDGVDQGKMTLKPRGLYETAPHEILVPAKSSVTVAVEVDASAFRQELEALMPNGYFLEGFVRFLTAEGTEAASLPFVGFRGEYQNLPAIEAPIYQNPNPFYGMENLGEGYTFTHLVTGNNRFNRETGKYEYESELVGLYVDREGQVSFREDMFAISPDLDPNALHRHKNGVTLRTTVLRSFEDLRLRIYAESDTQRQNPLLESPVSKGGKINNQSTLFKSNSVVYTGWSGQDKFGNQVPDGRYQYVVSYRPQVPGADYQELSFSILVDSQPPTLEGVTYDKEKGTVHIQGLTDSLSGLHETHTYLSWISTDAAGQRTEHKVYPDAFGQYQLGQEVDLIDQAVFLIAEDKAGNILTKSLAGLLGLGDLEPETEVREPVPENSRTLKMFEPGDLIEDMGRVGFALTDPATGEDLSRLGANNGVGSRIEIRDAAGTTVGVSINGSPVNLPYGEYLAILRLYDRDKGRVISSPIQAFSLSADSRESQVDFLTEPISRTDFRVTFQEELPQGAEVWLVAEDGRRYQLPKGRYVPTAHELPVPNGAYTLMVSLPEGYTASQNNIPVIVDENNWQLALTWIRKTDQVTA